MKQRLSSWGILVLAIFLVALPACARLQPEAKRVKAILPGAGPVEAESTQPAYRDEAAQPTGPAECTYTDPHPIGLSIADTYDIPYEQVMSWFCQGYSFENILIALETSTAVDISPEILLEMLLEKEWEEIWDEVGLTGTP